MDKIKSLRLPNCALCSLPFSTDGHAQFRNIKLPLLLHCGHSACESCLNVEFQSKKEVECKICNAKSSVSDDFSCSDLSREFPINHYLAGIWYLKIIISNTELDSDISFTKPKICRSGRPNRAIICNECSNSPADYHCKQCEAPYCVACYKVVHTSAKAFRNHVKLSVFESYFCMDVDRSLMCLNHNKYKLEYYCNPCRSPVCSHCMVESHNGHAVEKIDSVEVEYEEDFIDCYTNMSNMLTRMKTSKKKAEDILQQNKDIIGIKKAEDEISKHFICLHGRLSLIENKIRKKLFSANIRTSLEDAIKRLGSSIEDIEALLSSTRSLLNESTIRGPTCLAVIENFRSREKLPSCLIQSPNWKEPKFTVDENIFHAVENHCTLDIANEARYQLVTEECLPSTYDIETVQFVSREEIAKTLRKPYIISETSPNKSERRLSASSASSDLSHFSQTREPTDSLYYTNEIAIGCSVSVRISHLISPSHFYVQREYAQRKVLEFQASLRPFLVHQSKPPNHPEKGKIYLCVYGEDNKWYRARITDVIDSRTYDVFYIDFGNSEVVERSRLRNIPKPCFNMPFLAYRCQISDCVPRYGEEWDPRAISLMAEIIDNDFVTVTVVDKTSISYIVDLYKATENSFINLRESLSFHELASMTKMFNQTVDISVRQNISIPPQHVYSKGDIVEVHVSHVDSPQRFYVQDFKFSRKLIQLSEDMQRAYNIRNSYKNVIYDPKKGMIVAARYSKDSRWYRARIVEIIEGKRVKAFFIDFGNEELVLWDNIKILNQRFGNLPPQAIRCELSDVYPRGDIDYWTEGVCGKFRNMIFDKKLKIVVESVQNNNLNVILFDCQKEVDYCINAMIVNDGLATSTGANSIVAEFHKVNNVIPVAGEIQVEMGVEKRKAKKKIVKAIKNINDSGISDHFITMPGDNGVRTKIIVKRVINPGEFYVMPCCFEESIKNLKANLEEFYGSKKNIIQFKEWTVNEKCVINCEEQWHRAIVSDILSDGLIKVYLVDEGCEMTIESVKLYVLEELFAKDNDGVVKCHLGGLEPPLGTWSALSVSEFEEFVHNRKNNLYISQLGKIKNHSLPVELFSRTPIDAGPTEPLRDDWKSLNHYLRFIGQAKPDGMIQWDSDGQILKITQENEFTSVLEEYMKLSLTSNEEKNQNTDDNSVVNDTKSIALPQETERINRWLPPETLTNLEFIAAPTYVDDDCTVYLHNFHKSASLLEEISSALGTKYDGSLPRPHDATIEPGDVCIAQYHLDHKWYRAIVLEKFDELDEYKIQFADYGNVETCKLEELRKFPVAWHIPIQCYKCCFHNLVPVDPSGKWNERHIEIIQYNIVDKNCQIKLVELSDSNLYGIEELILPDGRNFISTIVKEGYARYKKNIKNDIDQIKTEISSENISMEPENPSCGQDDPSSEPEATTETPTPTETEKPSLLHWSSVLKSIPEKKMPKTQYKNFEIPPVVKSFIVEVSAFLSPVELILHIEDVEEDPVVLNMLEDFKNLSERMQVDCPHLSPLQPPFKYKACCSMFSVDKQWYRGFVLEELPDDRLLIQYVDYGNVEIVPASCVNEIPEEWTELPVFGILCNLYNISITEDSNPREVLQLMQDCFTQGTIKAEIKEKNPRLQVELYIDDRLAYNNLINKQLLNYSNRNSQ